MGELDRIRWHCRRGLLEVDLVLTRFLDRHLEHLAPEELDIFKAVLEYPDNDLWDVISERAEPLDPSHRPIVEMLRAC